jgi:hypothetical protein
MFVEINFKERKWLICGLYRPPSMTDDVFTEDFTKTFDKVSEKYDTVEFNLLAFATNSPFKGYPNSSKSI